MPRSQARRHHVCGRTALSHAVLHVECITYSCLRNAFCWRACCSDEEDDFGEEEMDIIDGTSDDELDWDNQPFGD
jgi:hypothetical protein